MKVALIGGAGLIGHHIALNLKSEGHEVLVVDALLVNNYYSIWEQRQKPESQIYLDMIDERLRLLRNNDIRLVEADAREYVRLSQIVGAFRPDKIVHLAAVAHIDRANKDPHHTFDHSLRTLENALDVARAVSVNQFVYFSSSTVYGDFKTPTVTEDSPCEPRGIYGSLKLAGELMVRAYGDLGLPWTIVRPCALYGPRCVSGRVTQKFLENAYFGRGSTIEGDGSGRHDFTYIGDLVHGIERVLTSPAAINQVFNLTADEARSLGELADAIRTSFPEARFEFGPVDPEKPSRGTLSCQKARDLLGYSPHWRLEEGMAQYAKWFVNFMEKRSYKYAS